jgi:uncharacterized membrane protein YfcA
MSPFSATLYWFMFPISIFVATCAVSSGIGGAALFGPIFLIIFPVMGHEYEIDSPRAAVALAILIETFGFGSGIIGYYRRDLINYKLALRLSAFSIPAAALSSIALIYIISATVLKFAYSLFMLMVSIYMLVNSSNLPWLDDFLRALLKTHHWQLPDHSGHGQQCSPNVELSRAGDESHSSPLHTVVSKDIENPPIPSDTVIGTSNNNLKSTHNPLHDSFRRAGPAEYGSQARSSQNPLHGALQHNGPAEPGLHELPTADDIQRSKSIISVKRIDYAAECFGGVLTGMLGVGTGETTFTLLLNREYSFPVAAATSTLVVALTCLCTAIIQLFTLLFSEGAFAIPWGIVIYALPGVIIGAQIATRLQGSLSKITVMRCVSVLFAVIGIAFMWLTAKTV